MRFLKRALFGWLAVAAAVAVGVITVKKKVPAYGDESDDGFSLVAVVGGEDFVSSAQHFVEGKALAVLGGINMDLSGAALAPGAKLKLRAVMGGIDVSVPRSCRVEVIATEHMGEVANLLEDDDQDDEGPLLLVYAAATMGGIAIRASKDS